MASIQPIPATAAGQVDALPQPYDTQGYSPDAYGAGLGDVATRASQVIAGIAKDAQEKADTTAVIDAIGKAKSSLNGRILDPVNGYAATKGADAITQREKALSSFNQDLSDIESGLTNDDQRRVFDQHLNTIREQGVLHAYSHEATQQEDLAKARYRGAADATVRTMQSVIGDPQQVQQQIDDLRQISTAEALRQFGRDPSAVQAVVGPEMQRAAIAGMEAATAPGSPPQVAQAALEKLKPFLGNHEYHYANLVAGVVQHAEVNRQAAQIIGTGLQDVVLPGGEQAKRIDPSKVLTQLANLKPDDPNRDAIEREVDRRQKAWGDAWNQNVARVVTSAQQFGDPSATGEFNMDRVPVGLRLWLRANAEPELIKLRALDQREARATSNADRAQQKADSAENYSTLLADMTDDAQWAGRYAKMTPQQFKTSLLDDRHYPGGFIPQDAVRAQKFFAARMQSQDKLDEKPEKIIKDEIGEAYATRPVTRAAFEKKYFGSLFNQTAAFIAAQKGAGAKVDSTAVRAFVHQKMQKVPSGSIFTSDRRQIEMDVENQPQTTAATPVAAPRRISAYRYNADRSMRIPVYDDGTQGTAEANQ